MPLRASALSAAEERALEVIVQLHCAQEDADDVLRRRVAALHDVPAEAVRVGRACPRCGSSLHGRPWAQIGALEIPVSLSRCGPHLMTAVAPAGAVGVDLEAIAAVGRGWDEELVLHPQERRRSAPRTDAERAAVWARKEAVLKMLGTGLATAMSAVDLAEHQVIDVPAPPGHVAALAQG